MKSQYGISYASKLSVTASRFKFAVNFPKVFGAEQLLRYSDQQQEVLLGVLMENKQAVIQPNGPSSTDVRLICEVFDSGLPVQLA